MKEMLFNLTETDITVQIAANIPDPLCLQFPDRLNKVDAVKAYEDCHTRMATLHPPGICLSQQ